MFTLAINCVPFGFLQYQVTIRPSGPQNLLNDSTIYLNDIRIHKGFRHWNETSFDEIKKGYDTGPTTGFKLDWFKTSSSEVLNQVIDDIGRSLEQHEGLKRLEISNFCDYNSLQMWPLSQIMTKSPHCESVKIFKLLTTTENRSTLIQFVG